MTIMASGFSTITEVGPRRSHLVTGIGWWEGTSISSRHCCRGCVRTVRVGAEGLPPRRELREGWLHEAKVAGRGCSSTQHTSIGRVNALLGDH